MWPILGNHDYDPLPYYLGFFTLPTNGSNNHYYHVALDSGHVAHMFALAGDDREPNGNTSSSIQGHWL